MTGTTVRVAVVGAGPSGIFTAQELASDPRMAVDVLDRLPVPFGLLRYGVAPDHHKMKSLQAGFTRVLEHERVRFLGNVQVGSAGVTAQLLRHLYDAVVYASGAPGNRSLGIDGESLAGVVPAAQLVAWYSGHPDADLASLPSGERGVVVLGMGNVAVDVARVLVKGAQGLRETDVPDTVLDALDSMRLKDLHVVGRRGPRESKFTVKELSELGEIEDLDLVVHASEAELAAAEGGDSRMNGVLKVLNGWKQRGMAGASRRLHFRFGLSPKELARTTRHPDGARVTSVVFSGRTPGAQAEIPADLVVPAVGSVGVPVPGLPFDPASGTIPHDAGRITHAVEELVDGAAEYVVGWIKRGATGVIGTNRADARETVETLRAELDARSTPRPDPIHRLRTAAPLLTTWDGWQQIDIRERHLGVGRGALRVKIPDWDGLLQVAQAGMVQAPGEPSAPRLRSGEATS